MKKSKILIIFILALMLITGSMGMAYAEETNSTSSKVEISPFSGGRPGDLPLPIEEQVAKILKNKTITNDQVVAFLKKIMTAQKIDAKKVDSYMSTLQSTSQISPLQLSEDDISLEAQIARVLVGPNLTSAQKKSVLDALGQTNDAMSTNTVMTINITDKVLSVPYYKQENGYYCAPATTKQTLGYFLSSTQSQSYYAPLVGEGSGSGYYGVGTKLINYVNTQQSHDYYVYTNKADNDVTLMQSHIDYDMTNYDPTIFNIHNPTTLNWIYGLPYDSYHFLNISGQYSNGNYQMTDPWIGWAKPDTTEGDTGKFTQSTTNVYAVFWNIGW